jgi:M6 family metalloprotease-like protein
MIRRIFISTLLVLLAASTTYAVPASPVDYTLRQPDGASFTARQWGDEWNRGWQTADGYTIDRSPSDGYWRYVVPSLGGLRNASPQGGIVGQSPPPAGIEPGLRPEPLLRSSSPGRVQAPARAVSSFGAANVPVLMVNFADTTTTYVPNDFEELLFGAGSGSMRAYYEEASYGAFTVSSGPDGVAGWFQAAENMAYYGANSGGWDIRPAELVREAVAAADGSMNFADYDMDNDCEVDTVMIVHQGEGEEAGGGADTIWSHKWDLTSAKFYGDGDGAYVTNDSTAQCPQIKVNAYSIQPETLWGSMISIGVFAHEYGHSLGLPDLYDTDYSSRGVGDWSIMAGGSWNNRGKTPAHFSAWAKKRLGWVTPTVVDGELANESITEAAFNADVYQLGDDTEYFLIENRQRVGFDAYLDGAGLAIWHVDENAPDNDSECDPTQSDCAFSHPKVRLMQADGDWDLENARNNGDAGDLFPGWMGNRSFTPASDPNSNWYTSASDVYITDIGDSGTTMTATLTASSGVTPPGDDHGDDCATATPVALETYTPGSIETAGDVDAFRFSLAETREIVIRTASTGQFTDVRGVLLDDGCQTIDTDDNGEDGLNFRIERELPPGYYTVVVAHQSELDTGTYQLSVAAQTTGGGGDGTSTPCMLAVLNLLLGSGGED